MEYKNKKRRYHNAIKESIEGIALSKEDFLWKMIVVVIWIISAASIYCGLFITTEMIKAGIAAKEVPLDNYMVNSNYAYIQMIAVILNLLVSVSSVRLVTMMLIAIYALPILIIAYQAIKNSWSTSKGLNAAISKGKPHPFCSKMVEELQKASSLKGEMPIVLQDETGSIGDYSIISIWSLFRRNHSVILINKNLDDAQLLEEDEYKALIAHEIYHLKHHHRIIWLLRNISKITCCGSVLLPSILNFWKMEFEADRFATMCVGKETFCRALQKLYDFQKKSISTEQLLLSGLNMHFATPHVQTDEFLKPPTTLLQKIKIRWRAIINHFSGVEPLLNYNHPSYTYRIEEINKLSLDDS